MPLARTPPQKGPAPVKPSREHTFSPSQAFPDGTPLPPEMRSESESESQHTPTPAASARSSGPVPTPWPESHEDMRVPSALQRQEAEDADEMDIDAELEATPRAPKHPQQATPSQPVPSSSKAIPRSPSPSSVPVNVLVMPTTPSGRRKSRRQTRDPELLAEETAESQSEALGEPRPVSVSPEPEDDHPHPTETPTRKRQRKSKGGSTEEQEAPPPVTPRRVSRAVTPARTPAEVLAEPAVPVTDAEEAQYGKYYEALVRTLRINAIDRGLSRLT